MSASRSRPPSVPRPTISRRSMKVESLPRPVSITSGPICGRCAAVTSITSAPCAASVRPHTGPAMTRVRSSTRTPLSGRSPGGSGCGGASPMRSIENAGRPATARPCGCASHSANERVAVTTSPASRRRGLERFRLPAVERLLHRGAVVLAAEQLEHAVAVMRKIRVQAHPAPVAAAIEPRRSCPTARARGLPSMRR